MNRHGTDKPRWQKHYQYELAEMILGKNKRQIRYLFKKHCKDEWNWSFTEKLHYVIQVEIAEKVIRDTYKFQEDYERLKKKHGYTKELDKALKQRLIDKYEVV
jgi:hypothetical protein